MNRRQRKAALVDAVRAGDLSAVRTLCEQDEGLAASQTSHGNGPLGEAIGARHLAIAELLIERGADPAARNHGGWSHMDTAAGRGGEPFVELLRRHGVAYEVQHAVGVGDVVTTESRLDADPAALERPVGRRRSHLLHIAAREGQAEVAVRLLARGAQVDALDKEDFTPLAVLTAYGQRSFHAEVARVLLDAGADRHAQCGYSGRDIVEYAAWKRHRALSAVLGAQLG